MAVAAAAAGIAERTAWLSLEETVKSKMSSAAATAEELEKAVQHAVVEWGALEQALEQASTAEQVLWAELPTESRCSIQFKMARATEQSEQTPSVAAIACLQTPERRRPRRSSRVLARRAARS